MKTLADFTRRLARGVQLECLGQTFLPQAVGERRTVTWVGPRSFGWTAPRLSPAEQGVTFFPETEGVTWTDADTVQLMMRYGMILTLRFVTPVPPQVTRTQDEWVLIRVALGTHLIDLQFGAGGADGDEDRVRALLAKIGPDGAHTAPVLAPQLTVA